MDEALPHVGTIPHDVYICLPLWFTLQDLQEYVCSNTWILNLDGPIICGSQETWTATSNRMYLSNSEHCLVCLVLMLSSQFSTQQVYIKTNSENAPPTVSNLPPSMLATKYVDYTKTQVLKLLLWVSAEYLTCRMIVVQACQQLLSGSQEPTWSRPWIRPLWREPLSSNESGDIRRNMNYHQAYEAPSKLLLWCSMISHLSILYLSEHCD